MGTDGKKGTAPPAETADAAFLRTVVDLAERTAASLRGQEDLSSEVVRTTQHCLEDRKESEALTQGRIDALIKSKDENAKAVVKELKALTKKVTEVCALAPRQPKWLWCFRELVCLVEKKPLATLATLLGLALCAVVLAALGFNITDWIQPP